MFYIFILGGNYLPLYYVYLAKVGRKGWSLQNYFTKEGALALIYLQVSQVYILYPFHLIKSLNYLDCVFYYILLIKLIKYKLLLLLTIIGGGSSTL